MVEVHLFGRLRQFAENKAVDADSIAWVTWQSGDTVQTILERHGVDPVHAVSNVFVNGTYAYNARQMPIQDGERLGVFPKDMGMLYA